MSTGYWNVNSNFISPSATLSSLNITNMTVGSIYYTGSIIQNGTSASVLGSSNNFITTNLTNTNLLSTNNTLTNLILTSGSFGSLSTANISVSGNITVGGNLLVAGTLVSVNVTSVNVIDTNITAGTLNATNITSTNLVGTTATITNIIHTNISSSSLFSTNITTTNLVSTLISTTNLLTTNISTFNLLANSYTSGSFSPGAATLAINGPNQGTAAFIQTNGDTAYPGFWLVQSGATCSNKIFFYNAGNSTQNFIGIDTSGNMILTTPSKILLTSSNVGINTTSPAYTLDVNGSSRIAGSLLAISNANTLGNLYTTNGNVGINTTSPSHKLHITDTSSDPFSIYIDGTGRSLNSGININAATGFTPFINLQTNGAGSALIGYNTSSMSFTGSLGVNMTNAPNYTLDIAGTSRISTRLDIGGAQPNFSSSTIGQLFLTGNSGTQNGPHIVMSTNQDQFPTLHLLNYTHDNICLHFDSYFDGGFKTSSSNTAFQMYKQSSQLQFNYTTGSAGSSKSFTTAMIIGSSGNIGINQNSPGVPLHIGSGAVDSNVRNTVSLFVPGNDIESRYLYLGWAGGEARISSDTVTKPLTFCISDSEKMRISSAGNIGIGTISPAYTLDVNGSFRVQSNVNGPPNSASVINSNSGSSAYSIFALGNDTGNNLSMFLNSSTRSTDGGARNATLRNDSGDLRLASQGTNSYIYLNTSGNIGIGTSSPTAPLNISYNNTANTSGNSGLDIYQQNTVGAYMRFFSANQITNFWHIGAEQGNTFHIYNQTFTGVYLPNGATSWLANSDLRIKNNISSFNEGLSKICNLNPVVFNYNTDTKDTPLRTGFIAQEVQQILPSIVSSRLTDEFPDGLLGLSMTEMIPYLVNSIKELNNKLTLVQNELDELKNKMN